MPVRPHVVCGDGDLILPFRQVPQHLQMAHGAQVFRVPVHHHPADVVALVPGDIFPHRIGVKPAPGAVVRDDQLDIGIVLHQNRVDGLVQVMTVLIIQHVGCDQRIVHGVSCQFCIAAWTDLAQVS